MRKVMMMVAALTMMASSARAADFSAPEPMPLFNWTGIYLGLAAGGGFEEADFSIKDHECRYLNGLCSIKHNPGGLVAGGEIYGLWQFQNTPFVVGAEVQGLFADLRDDRDAIFGLVKTETTAQDIFEAKGQLGYAFDRAYIYGTGGWAGIDKEAKAEIPILGAKWSDNQFLDGFVWGAGAKWVAVDGSQTGTPSVIFGLEWNHIQVDGNFASQVKFSGGSYAKELQSECYCEHSRLKVHANDDIDIITGNVSIKF
jgi:outer membrane immunogenic protein